jgi:hypothetical protein
VEAGAVESLLGHSVLSAGVLWGSRTERMRFSYGSRVEPVFMSRARCFLTIIII